MWRKMVKMREIARNFHRKELGNGKQTSFLYDAWSDRGVLFNLLGERGIVAMGIDRKASVEEVVKCVRRRRSHRSSLLNDI